MEYTVEQIDKKIFIGRCYNNKDNEPCTIHNQVFEKIYVNVTREQALQRCREEVSKLKIN